MNAIKNYEKYNSGDDLSPFSRYKGSFIDEDDDVDAFIDVIYTFIRLSLVAP